MIDVLCIGHAAFDITMTTTRHPGSDEKLQADAMMLGGGGPAANAAVQVARLGGKSAFCGYLGHDLFGEEHIDELHHEGVDTGLVVRGAAPSPISQILAKPDGSRSVVNFKGDTAWLPVDAVDTDRIASLAPGVILFDGHEPLVSESLCLWARDNGVPTVLDAGSLHRGTRDLATQVDFLVGSLNFARQFCETDEPDECLGLLAGMAGSMVITLGQDGLLWQCGREKGAMPAFAVEAVDSTGAGDAFHGAFAYGLSQDMPWESLLRYASGAGALTCTRLGARAALPDARQLAALTGQTG